MSANKEYTKRILNHYYRVLFEEISLNYDNDCESEVDEAVECIYNEIKSKDKKIKSLKKELKELKEEFEQLKEEFEERKDEFFNDINGINQILRNRGIR